MARFSIRFVYGSLWVDRQLGTSLSFRRGGGELHPLVAFVSAFAGLAALGFYGLFIGPVIVGLFFVLLSLHDARTLAINESLNLEERSSQ